MAVGNSDCKPYSIRYNSSAFLLSPQNFYSWEISVIGNNKEKRYTIDSQVRKVCTDWTVTLRSPDMFLLPPLAIHAAVVRYKVKKKVK